MGEIAEQKERIRNKLLERRQQLEETDYLAKSQTIIDTLQCQPEFEQAETVHCYVSMNERREVNTHQLIKKMLSEDKKVVVPRTEFSTGELSHFYLENFDDLIENKWGVLEPKSGKKANLVDLNLIIVPMAGGDKKKNRIGYGKGFYDRFLNKVTAPAIGLLFEDCLLKKIPVEKFDVPLDKFITEKKVIY